MDLSQEKGYGPFSGASLFQFDHSAQHFFQSAPFSDLLALAEQVYCSTRSNEITSCLSCSFYPLIVSISNSSSAAISLAKRAVQTHGGGMKCLADESQPTPSHIGILTN